MMKVKLTKDLSGRYAGKAGDVIEIDPVHLDSIIRQNAGIVLKDEEPKKKDDKKKETA